MIWRAGRFDIDFARPRVMGIVNLTPDSFSDGEPSHTPASAVARCEQLLTDGAEILDLGAESSRPGAEPVSAAEELARLLPVLREALRLGCPISVDTMKPEVMRVALDLGADIVNDIGALQAPGALEAVGAHPRCGVCLMHMRGTPQSMLGDTAYEDVVAEVGAFLRQRLAATTAAGIAAERVVLDPGIGFAKTPEQNLALLARQRELLASGRPLLVGWSRKSTLARLAGLQGVPRADRTVRQLATLDTLSCAAALLAVQAGASVVRVHDVASAVAVLALHHSAGIAAR